MIPHEDKVDVISPIKILIPHGDIVGDITRNNILFRGGGESLTPHEDKVDVITRNNILFIGGGEF